MVQCRRHSAAQKGDTPTAKNGRLTSLPPESHPEGAFLAAVEITAEEALWDADDSLAELASLARTAGAEVAGTLIQRLRTPDPATYLGKGRANELTQLRADLDF